MKDYETSIVVEGIRSELSAWMTHKGLELCLYMGSDCEPVVDGLVSYKDLIDQELYACQGPNGEYDAWAEKFVMALEDAAYYAREKLERTKIEE
jgi:hypothetical protein